MAEAATGASPTAAPSVYKGFRMALAVGGVCAIGAFVALAVIGQPAIGALVLCGFVIGAWNSWRVVEAGNQLGRGVTGLRSVGFVSMRRLGYITLLVVAVAIAFRPIGWTIVLGLAGYQLILVASSIGPLLREVRRA